MSEKPVDSQSVSARATAFRWMTLIGYFALLALILNWFTWISPPTEVPRAFLLIVLCVPLMFPLRGLLYARPYTHSWVSFLSLFYFAIGVDVAFNRDNDRTLGLLMLGFSILLFTGSVFFSYYEKKRVRLSQKTQEPITVDNQLNDEPG